MNNDVTLQNQVEPPSVVNIASAQDANLPTISTFKPLGHIKIEERTFSEDLEVSDRYQNFSAEILRLALLGFAGIGFLIANILVKGSGTSGKLSETATPTFKYCVAVSLACLGLSAAGALLHRYFSTDSLACILLSLRLDLRGRDEDKIRSKKEKQKRDWLFQWSGRLLFISGTFLWLGAVFLALAFIFGIMF